jgi:hypothetical protein
MNGVIGDAICASEYCNDNLAHAGMNGENSQG